MEEAATVESVKRRRASRKSAFAHQMREKGYLTSTEVVEKIRVHKTTLYRWIREGQVEALDFNGAYYIRWSSVIEHLGEVARALGLTREIDAGSNGAGSKAHGR